MIKSRSSVPIRGKVNQRLHLCREYLMYNRVPVFFAVSCFGSSPTLSRHQVVSLSQSSYCHRSSLLTGEGGAGAKSYDGEKALSSINHAILSAFMYVEVPVIGCPSFNIFKFMQGKL
jgi:hypothetical protein